MQLSERLIVASTPRRICAFKSGEDVYFYNRSLFRWLSLDGGVRGELKTTMFHNQAVYSGKLPEGVLIAKLYSGEFGEWKGTSWGYEIVFDMEDHPLWL